jgi:hypothetical protein
MNFKIENFKQMDDMGNFKAVFNCTTDGGMYYAFKLMDGANGYWVSSAQSREYTKGDGSKGYANAFGSLKGSKAADFFNEVAKEAAGMLSSSHNTNNNQHEQQKQNGYMLDDDLPF